MKAYIDDILNTLRAINEYKELFLLEISQLAMLICFILGTVDVFTRGDMATNPVFNTAWAIVQAISFDGLVLVIWLRIARTVKWDTFVKNIPMIFLACILAIVAVVVNAVVTLQEWENITDSLTAMLSLGINIKTLVIVRSSLVVLCFITVCILRSISVPQTQGACSTLVPLKTGEDHFSLSDVSQAFQVPKSTAYRKLKKSQHNGHEKVEVTK